jgi:AraC family transcriptional regulator
MTPTTDIPIWWLPIDRPPRIAMANFGVHGNWERSMTYLLHSHWCIHWYDYPGEIQIGDWVGEIRPGVLSIVPPGQVLIHRWRQKNSRHYFAHFGVGAQAGEPRPVPAWSFSADDSVRALMVEVGSGFAVQAASATAALWQCLWQIAGIEPTGENTGPVNPVSGMQRYIEQHLEKPLSLDKIAREFHLSANHANRLFKKATGSTICAYWRNRRIETACGLLRHTSMRVKEVALQCGYQDLQQFNKLIRNSAGSPPRKIRLNRRSPSMLRGAGRRCGGKTRTVADSKNSGGKSEGTPSR